MKNFNKLKLIGFFIVTISSLGMLTPVYAIPISDAQDDVWSANNTQRGDFADAIDIINIKTDGWNAIIECQRIFDATSDSESILKFLVLYNSDNNPVTWEAALLFTYVGPTNHVTIHWITNNVLNSSSDDWQLDNSGNHYSIQGNSITLSFPEFPNAYSSTITVLSHQENVDSSDRYYDWAPDYYQNTIFFHDISIVSMNNMKLYEYYPEDPPPHSSNPESSPGFEFLSFLAFIPLFFIFQRKRQ